jgi:hypothetical protein
MSLKCLNPDSILPLAGRSRPSASVCSVDNKSSSLLQGSDSQSLYFPNCQRVVRLRNPRLHLRFDFLKSEISTL